MLPEEEARATTREVKRKIDMILERLEKCFSTNGNASVRHQSIKLAAYLKAEKAGFPHGQEVQFWTEAEREYDEKYEKLMADKSPWDRLMYKIGIHG